MNKAARALYVIGNRVSQEIVQLDIHKLYARMVFLQYNFNDVKKKWVI